jgi:glycosyltransferase involved in cell wall biosynthesis
VIAFGRGGAAETVVDGTTGVLFAEQSVAALQAAMLRAEDIPFSADELWTAAQRFSAERFEAEIAALIETTLAARRRDVDRRPRTRT